MEPLLTIITPSLNRVHMIDTAIESVLNQNYPHVEHIIVDGGSKDGTLDLLKKYRHLKIIVEPDKNLYDAINKGINLAKGEIIGHLNSDDYYEPNSFQEIIEIFKNKTDCDSVCGGASIFEEINGIFKKKEAYTHKRFLQLNLENIAYGMPIINARFFRKSVYDKVGHYDINYPLGGDREFLFRANIHEIHTYILPKIIYHYRHHQGSLTINNNKANDKIPCLNAEYLAIIEKYQGISHLPKRIYKTCRNWHTWMIGYTLMLCLRNKYKAEARNLIKQGFAEDPLFLLRYFIQRLKHYWFKYL